MTVTSNPPPSPSFPPPLQPSSPSSSNPSSNPWNRNPSGPLPGPFMGGPSSWPPLPSSSSSQIRDAVIGTATTEQTPDETRTTTEVIDSSSIPVPRPSSDPSPESTVESNPAPASAEFNATPILCTPRRRGPNHTGPNHQRNRNHKPQHGRGSRVSFFPDINGGSFNPASAHNWNRGFGFGPMWPQNQHMGIPLGAPFPIGPFLNYYDVNMPPIPIPLPHYQGTLYTELNRPFYPFPLPSPGALPLGAVPVGPHASPPLPTPMNLDQKAVRPPTRPPPSTNVDQKAVLLVELRKQIEYYFSDQNLVRDEYLRRQMDDEGWVDIRTIAGFPKVATKTSDLKVVEEALSSSDSVESQDGKLRKKDGWARYCLPKF